MNINEVFEADAARMEAKMVAKFGQNWISEAFGIGAALKELKNPSPFPHNVGFLPCEAKKSDVSSDKL